MMLISCEDSKHISFTYAQMPSAIELICLFLCFLFIGLFQKKDHFFGQKISKILCLVFDFICIYYIESDY